MGWIVCDFSSSVFAKGTFSLWASGRFAGCAHLATPKISLQLMILLLLSWKISVPMWLIASDSSTMITSVGSERLVNTKWSVTFWLNINHTDEEIAINAVFSLCLGCGIPSQNPLLWPERKSLHCFGYQPGYRWWKSFSKRIRFLHFHIHLCLHNFMFS